MKAERPVWAAVVVALCLVADPARPSQRPDPADAESLAKKLEGIRERHAAGVPGPTPIRVSEAEANAYLLYRAIQHFPDEVTEPWVRFGQDGVEGGALVDMRLLAESLSGSALSRLLSGPVPVEVAAQVQAANGVGRVKVQSVTLSGVELPDSLVRKLVSHYSKGVSPPNGVQLDDPFPLPFGILSAKFRPGRVILRQGNHERPAELLETTEPDESASRVSSR